MTAIYNEIEPFACDWLQNLINAGHIAHGRVERRSIKELQPTDVAGDGQRHFFAGIGVWSHALRLADWPDDVSVWTGSCPCQPFSAAGRRNGLADERHLWPEWFRLIRECRPAAIFGEQVASKDGLAWFDDVSADLERAGYAVGAADLCAAGVGAPHIRQRLYFAAFRPKFAATYRLADDDDQRMGNADVSGPQGRRIGGDGSDERTTRTAGLACGLAHADGGACDEGSSFARGSDSGGDAVEGTGPRGGRSAGPTGGFWSAADWLPCLDGKARPVEPGTFPLAHGAANRVGRLRGYGNAIVPQVAATFIRAAMEAA